MAEYRYVHGMQELQRNFALVSQAVGAKIVRRGAAAAAQVVKRATIQNVQNLPRRSREGTGTMARAVIVNFRRDESNETQAVYIVTFRRGKAQQAHLTKKGRRTANRDAFYAPFVEFGHGVRAMRVPRKSQRKVDRVPAYPTLGPALERNIDEEIRAMENTVRAEFEKVLIP
jgi:hypothetical protein